MSGKNVLGRNALKGLIPKNWWKSFVDIQGLYQDSKGKHPDVPSAIVSCLTVWTIPTTRELIQQQKSQMQCITKANDESTRRLLALDEWDGSLTGEDKGRMRRNGEKWNPAPVSVISSEYSKSPRVEEQYQAKQGIGIWSPACSSWDELVLGDLFMPVGIPLSSTCRHPAILGELQRSEFTISGEEA